MSPWGPPCFIFVFSGLPLSSLSLSLLSSLSLSNLPELSLPYHSLAFRSTHSPSPPHTLGSSLARTRTQDRSVVHHSGGNHCYFPLSSNSDADRHFRAKFRTNHGELAGVQGINLFVSQNSITFLFVSLDFVEFRQSYGRLKLCSFPAESGFLLRSPPRPFRPVSAHPGP